MLRWVLRILAGLVASLGLCVAVVWIGGSFLPQEHLASSRATVHAPPDTVFATLIDVEHQASWRKDIRSIERLADHEGHPVYRLTDHERMSYPLELTEIAPPSRVVSVITDTTLSFGGAWTFELAPAPGGTMVTITEHGWVRDPAFRFFAHYVFGLHATMDRYLEQLGTAFGETVTPVRVVG